MLLDVRWQLGGPSQYPLYLAGHLPGARWCDLETDLADPPGQGGRHPLPDPRRLETVLRAWGVEPRRHQVVVYDQGNSVAAARAWWVLRWAGMRQVQVLDGGFDGLGAARAIRCLPSCRRRPPAAISVRPGSLPTLDADTAAAWGQAGRLFDVRATERFRGELEPIDPVAGHIPGRSTCPPLPTCSRPGTSCPMPTCDERFLAAGVARDGAEAMGQPVGVYCGSGVTAAHTVLAMQVAGIEAVLYPGHGASGSPTRPGRWRPATRPGRCRPAIREPTEHRSGPGSRLSGAGSTRPAACPPASC